MAVPCANYLLEAAAYNHEMGKIKKRKHLSDTKQCLIEPIMFDSTQEAGLSSYYLPSLEAEKQPNA